MIELFTILLMLLLNSLAINGLYLSVQRGMIFDFIDDFAYSNLKPIWKPLCGCITCMASIWSWPFWFVSDNWVYYIGYIFALAAVNTAIYNTFFDE